MNHRQTGTAAAIQVSLASCSAGMSIPKHEADPPNESLWTFNPSTSRWTQQHATGELPDPMLACASRRDLAVVGDSAYLLVKDPVRLKRMMVYRLNLRTWHWQLLPHKGSGPACITHAAATVFQVLSVHDHFVISVVSAVNSSVCMADLQSRARVAISSATLALQNRGQHSAAWWI